MENEIKAPEMRLIKEAVPALRWGSAVSHTISLGVVAFLYGIATYFSWWNWVSWVLFVLAELILLSAIWSVGLRPVFLVRHFRYGIDEDFLQLKTGAFYESHELVPMAKIQAVSMNQGPILRKFGLYSLAIETMGSGHEIPALPKDTAVEVRNQIARMAKIREVDD